MPPSANYQCLDGLFRNMVAGAIILRDEQILYANPSAVNFFGFQKVDELYERRGSALFAEWPVPVQSGIQAVLGISASGHLLPLQGELTLIQLPDGQATMLFITNKQQQFDEYQQLLLRANYDSLTGLPNRTLFNDRFQHAMAKAARQQSLLALLFIDLVKFKNVNDTLGHAAGDLLLKKIALRLSAITRGSDTVARLAGDEFVVLLEDISDAGVVESIAAKIACTLSQPIQIKQQSVRVNASIGIAFYPQDGVMLETLMQHADQAMYRAKAEGGSCIKFYADRLDGTAGKQLNRGGGH